MKVGYARVSSDTQSLDLQIEMLEKEGCDRIFSDTCSGIKEERTGLEEALAFLREGDQLIVWKLDRLGRSLKHLLEVTQMLDERNIDFHSMHEKIDTSTPVGRLTFNVFGAIAEFEREIIRERCRVGLERARARGRIGGRPSVMTNQKKTIAQQLYNSKELTVSEICEELEISRSTFYRHVGE